MGAADQDGVAPEAHRASTRRRDRILDHELRDRFWVSSAQGFSAQQWNVWVRGHWRIENGSHYVRDATFAEDASRIRKNPDIAARLRSFAYNLLRANGNENIKNARWRASLDLNFLINIVLKR